MKKSAKRQSWKAGDCFLIPLSNGEFVIGQVLAHEPKAMNSVSCALFDQKQPIESPCDKGVSLCPDTARLFSTALITRDSLDSGRWKVVGNWPITVSSSLLPFESTRSSGFIGAKIYGSRNFEKFVNSFYGLDVWDDWADPFYLDALLITPEAKPKHLRYKSASK